MVIPVLVSIKAIQQQFHTGEEPVLVLCSDKNAYICKYMRSSNAAYKLTCELRVVENKIKQLFDEQWIYGVWNNFVECLNDNLR